jgi:WD40 repeat protein
MKRYILGILLWSFLGIASQTIAEEPKLVIDPQGHSALIGKLIFTPNGNRLISISHDKTVRLWDVETGDLIKTLRGQIGEGSEGRLYTGAISPDGNILAIGGRISDGDQKYIRLLHLESGEQIGLIKGYTDAVNGLAFSPDGNLLASGGDKTVKIWDTSSLSAAEGAEVKLLVTLEGHTDGILDVAFSPDGTKVVSASYDHTIRLWELPKDLQNFHNSGDLKYTDMKKHTAEVGCVAYSPDGKYIVSGGWDKKVLLWDNTGKFLKKITTCEEEVSSISFSADSQKIAVSGGGDFRITLYAIPSGKKGKAFKKHTKYVFASTFYGNDLIASAGGDEKDIYIWDASSRKVKTHITSKGKTIWAVAFGQDMNIAFGQTYKAIDDSNRGPLKKSFDFSEMTLARQVPEKSKITRTQRKYQGKTVEKVSSRELKVKGVGTFETPIEDGDVKSYTFTKDGNIAVGSADTLRLFQIDGTFMHELVGHTDAVWAVSASEDGRFLVSASDDQTIKLWNPQTGELLATLFVATDNEWICWTPQGYYEASAGGEKYIGWHINQGVDKAAKYYPVSVFRKRFHQPELVKRTIAVGSFQQALQELNAESEEKIEETAVTEVLPPSVQWTSPKDPITKTSQPSIQIRAEILSNSEITTMKVLVNGRTQVTERGLRIDEPQTVLDNIIEQEIPLKPGKNEIAIFAANADAGTPSETRIVFYDAEEVKPDLYLVSIGISGYQRSELQLSYADDDARAISQLFSGQQGKLYKNVTIKELYDQDATQGEIIDAIEWLKTQATQKDVAVIFIAAHGHNEHGEYYLLPADGNPEELERTGVSWQVFSEGLGNLPSRILLFLDTCHSGQLGQDFSVLGRQVDNTEALRKLSSDEYGVVILAASTGREFSMEHPKWKHGAFTKTLVEALGQGEADYSNDGMINLRELDMYVADRVEELTDNQQHPTTQKPSTISRFPIVQVK